MDPQGNWYYTGIAWGKETGERLDWKKIFGFFIKRSNNNINNDKTLSWSLRTILWDKVYKDLGLHTWKPQLGRKIISGNITSEQEHI